MRDTTDNVAHDDNKSFYNHFWSHRPALRNKHELIRAALIIKAIAEHVPDAGNRLLSICDFGCGIGWLSNELTKFGQVTGIDFSSTAIESAIQHWPGINFQVGDVRSWIPAKSYDLVVSSEVAEHIPDENKPAYFQSLAKLVSPAGYLLITTPNKKVKTVWARTNHENQLLEQWLTPGELRKNLETEFSIIDHSTFFFEYSNNSYMRIVNSVKLRKILHIFHLLRVFDGLASELGLGLYQLLVAKRRASPTGMCQG